MKIFQRILKISIVLIIILIVKEIEFPNGFDINNSEEIMFVTVSSAIFLILLSYILINREYHGEVSLDEELYQRQKKLDLPYIDTSLGNKDHVYEEHDYSHSGLVCPLCGSSNISVLQEKIDLKQIIITLFNIATENVKTGKSHYHCDTCQHNW